MEPKVFKRESFDERTPVDQVIKLNNWIRGEDLDVLEEVKTINDLLEMYKFIRFDVGVDFLYEVYEAIVEDTEDGINYTLDLVDKFNKRIGYELIKTYR